MRSLGGSVRLKRPMRPLGGSVRLKRPMRPLGGSVRLKRLMRLLGGSVRPKRLMRLLGGNSPCTWGKSIGMIYFRTMYAPRHAGAGWANMGTRPWTETGVLGDQNLQTRLRGFPD